MADRQGLHDRFVRDLKAMFGVRAREVARSQMHGDDPHVRAAWKRIVDDLDR